MPIGDNLPPQSEQTFLNLFEPPPQFIEPAVRAWRLFNTALDGIFYDVSTLAAQLAEKDAPMRARGEKAPSRIVEFDALSNPEGSLLLIDATTAPYVHKYTNVELFLSSPYQETRDVEIATITGVGSSALGSAALAWDISLALEKPVLAIVPGYGMADVVLQALGGWFGFGLYLHAKSLIQNSLANVAPQTRPCTARPSFVMALVRQTSCMPSSPFVKRRSNFWSGIAREHFRSEIRSSRYRRSGPMHSAL